MVFSIFDNSCDVILDDEFYLDYKSKLFVPTATDEDIRDYMAATLGLYVLYAVMEDKHFTKNDDKKKYAMTILKGTNKKKKQIIYDKCKEYLKEDMDVYEVLNGENFQTAIQTLIQEEERVREKDVLERNAYDNPPDAIHIPTELFSENADEKEQSLKALFELFKETGIINLDNWVIYYHVVEEEMESVSIDNPNRINKWEKPEIIAMVSLYHREDEQISDTMGIGESVEKPMTFDEIPTDTLLDWFRHIIDGIIRQIQCKEA